MTYELHDAGCFPLTNRIVRHGLPGWWLLMLVFLLAGCVSSLPIRMAEDLTRAIAENDDIETIKAGSPAYLLMMDGLVRNAPEDSDLLRKAADFYTGYAGFFQDDSQRARKLTEKGLAYALQAVCLADEAACGIRETPFQSFAAIVSRMGKNDLPYLYCLGSAWAAWIQARRDDWSAIAEISRVEALMMQAAAMEESYDNGGAHLYLGVLATLLPQAMGGKPETGRSHFERAIELSKGKNLMAKVLYARQYARLIYDQPLHDRLLTEVLQSPVERNAFTLVNALAREQAGKLLETSKDYFE